MRWENEPHDGTVDELRREFKLRLYNGDPIHASSDERSERPAPPVPSVGGTNLPDLDGRRNLRRPCDPVDPEILIVDAQMSFYLGLFTGFATGLLVSYIWSII